MKILHTSDWHVGKVLKGRDRHDEHVAVLRSLVQTARDEDVDLVLIAGDVFETAAPSARAQGLVMRTLLALRPGAGRRGLENIPRDQHQVHVLITGGLDQAAQDGDVLVVTVAALEDLADVPVAGVQDFHYAAS